MTLYIFALVVVAVVGWFAVGTQVNVRKGHKALEWLQGGLKQLGEKTTLRWLGSSAVELKIQSANAPFRNAEVVVVLEPRDVSLLWAFYRARGRRDLLIVRGQLRHPPAFELEAFDPRCWSARGLEARLRFRNWNQIELPSSSLLAYTAGKPVNVAGLLETVSLNCCTPARFALRRSEPNFEVHWNLADVQRMPANDVLKNLSNVSELIPR
jgi:hypothetical protein